MTSCGGWYDPCRAGCPPALAMNRSVFLFRPRITLLQGNKLMEKKAAKRPDIPGMARRGEAGELIGAARGSDPGTLSDILDALVGLGDAAVPALLEALRDEDHRVHVVASIALGKIGKPAVLPLVRALRERDGATRVKIADILADIGDPAVLGIVAALRDPDEEVRVLSAFALGEIRDPRAIDPLIVALRDGSEKVRAQAAISLGELGAPGAGEALAGVAETDASPAVREVAVNALIRVRRIREDRASSRPGDLPGDQTVPR
jgi:hypothetical protein